MLPNRLNLKNEDDIVSFLGDLISLRFENTDNAQAFLFNKYPNAQAVIAVALFWGVIILLGHKLLSCMWSLDPVNPPQHPAPAVIPLDNNEAQQINAQRQAALDQNRLPSRNQINAEKRQFRLHSQQLQTDLFKTTSKQNKAGNECVGRNRLKSRFR